MKSKTIVIVEDEADILDVMSFNLEREGYTVHGARDGEAGWRLVREQTPHLVILDLMLPSADGIELCRRIRADDLVGDVPVIMVTAKDAESDVVLGLGVGADDYVTKPFSPRELVARVRAVLRRGRVGEATASKERVVRGGLVIDKDRFAVTADGAPIGLTPTEFRLLHFLASHPGRAFTRDQLLTRAIGEDAFVVDRNIDVHIRSIRKKLDGYRELVETIRGVGYRFSEKTGE